MDMTGYGLCPLAVTVVTKALPALLVELVEPERES
jgi:hypothetical protein